MDLRRLCGVKCEEEMQWSVMDFGDGGGDSICGKQNGAVEDRRELWLGFKKWNCNVCASDLAPGLPLQLAY